MFLKFCTSILVLAFCLGPVVLAQEPLGAPDEAIDPLKHGIDVTPASVAIINGEAITWQDFIESVTLRYREHQLGNEALDDLLRMRVVEKNMADRKLDISEADVQEEYEKLDAQFRAANKKDLSITDLLKQRGQTEHAFRERLRIQIALKRMAEEDFTEVKNVDATYQTQWLRSKTVEAKVEMAMAKIPKGVVAMVYGEPITAEQFTRNVILKIQEKDLSQLLSLAMHKRLAAQMCKTHGLSVSAEKIDSEYARAKQAFSENPKFEGIHFEDMIKQQTGMSPNLWKQSNNLYVAVAMAELGTTLVPDKDMAAAYAKDADWYGPIIEVKHILIRGSDDPKFEGRYRSLKEALAQANTVLKKTQDGEEFDELIKLFSDDTRTKFNGGVLATWVPRRWQGHPGMWNIIKDLKPGEIGGPVSSSSGYHILQLDKRLPIPPITTDAVRDLRKRRAVLHFESEWKKASRGVNLRRFMQH